MKYVRPGKSNRVLIQYLQFVRVIAVSLVNSKTHPTKQIVRIAAVVKPLRNLTKTPMIIAWLTPLPTATHTKRARQAKQHVSSVPLDIIQTQNFVKNVFPAHSLTAEVKQVVNIVQRASTHLNPALIFVPTVKRAGTKI